MVWFHGTFREWGVAITVGGFAGGGVFGCDCGGGGLV
jgi:hypothetical protein